MRRAALLGNKQAIEYLQDRGLYVTMNNFVDPLDNSAAQTIARATETGGRLTLMQDSLQYSKTKNQMNGISIGRLVNPNM